MFRAVSTLRHVSRHLTASASAVPSRLRVPRRSMSALTPLPKAIVMDIEGTVAPITFVTQVLFPYVTNNLPAYLDKTWDTPETQADIAALIAQSDADEAASVPGLVSIPSSARSDPAALKAAVVANVAWQMSLNRKMGALKGLQGHVWRGAYLSGDIKGELFDDVVPAMRAWVAQGVKLYIYSSGSVEAQKLVFGYSNSGDIRDLLSGYFDTAIGHKREKESYEAINAAIGCDKGEALFLTDVYEESVAADQAGMRTVLLVRKGNEPLPADNPFPTAASFAEL